jgi:hypothetical protein
LIQVKQSDATQVHAFSMAQIDWIQLIGITTLLVSVGTLCIVFFAI